LSIQTLVNAGILAVLLVTKGTPVNSCACSATAARTVSTPSGYRGIARTGAAIIWVENDPLPRHTQRQ